MYLLQCRLHVDVRYSVWIGLDYRHNRQLVYEGSKQTLRGCGFKLSQRMLDVPMKRDSALRVDTGIDCLA
jgi:hypothetical protein